MTIKDLFDSYSIRNCSAFTLRSTKGCCLFCPSKAQVIKHGKTSKDKRNKANDFLSNPIILFSRRTKFQYSHKSTSISTPPLHIPLRVLPPLVERKKQMTSIGVR